MAPVATGAVVEQGEPQHRSAPRTARSRLRVALVADAPWQPRWLTEAFSRLALGDFAEVAAVVELAPQRSLSCPGAYLRMDKWAFGLKPDPMERVELRNAVRAERYLSGEGAWRGELQAMGIDVIFTLGGVDADRLHGLARHGVWRYTFGAAGEHDDRLAGARELAVGAEVTPSGVAARLSAGEPERVLYESWSRIFPYSLARTRDNLLPKTSEFAARALKSLHEAGAPWLRACPPAPAVPRRRLPSLAPLLGSRLVRALHQGVCTGQWFLGYRFGAASPWDGDLCGFRSLVPPKDRFWADPFVIRRDGRHYVFFEELEFARQRAHISAIEIGRDGPCSAPVKVLERDYHLSYPFLLQEAGELYMIPETGDNETVEIYRCKRFPGEWRLEKVLLSGSRFTDATLLHADGRWWMFVNVLAPRIEGSDELHIYCSDRLLGDWKPHRGNPVKSDVRGARPAGNICREGAALYRPAQIGVPIYGWGISVNRIELLTPREYREKEVQRIAPLPERRILGVHTVNRAGDLTVIDAFTRRRPLFDRLPSFPERSEPGPARLSPCR